MTDTAKNVYLLTKLYLGNAYHSNQNFQTICTIDQTKKGFPTGKNYIHNSTIYYVHLSE